MTVYVVTYDLNKEESSADYKPLLDELRRLGCHRFQASAWLANLNNTSKEVHDHFKALMDSNDSLWVSRMNTAYFYSAAKSGTNDWLKQNPPS
jgi:CRISPR-associated endonuclease Cas2